MLHNVPHIWPAGRMKNAWRSRFHPSLRTAVPARSSSASVRRAQRLNPGAEIVICGCLAQRDGEALLQSTGARLVLGTARRGEVVELLELHTGTLHPNSLSLWK